MSSALAEGSLGGTMETIKRACALLYSVGLAAFVGTLLVPAPASAHTLASDHNLGKTTEWPSTGYTQEAEIPDVDGYGENTFRFEVERPGPMSVWTSGNFHPSLAIFDGLTRLTRWSGDHDFTIQRSGIYYVRASSSGAGGYRLHIVGGGKGHDDIGNVMEEAAPIPLCTGLASANPACKRPRHDACGMESNEMEVGCWDGNGVLDPIIARIDHRLDRDWFTFDVPEGPQIPVRIWTSGATDSWATLYDDYGIELETNNSSGDGGNFLIDRHLDPGTYFVGVYGAYSATTGPYRLYLAGRDDHGNFFKTARGVHLPTAPSGILGEIDYANSDRDIFWFRVSTPGNVKIQSYGNADTDAILYDEYEIELQRDNSSGEGWNFLIDRTLDPGVYYVAVTGRHTGTYEVHLSSDASGFVTVPLMLADTPVLPSDDTLRQWGFVRIINHSDQSAEVGITAVDDSGMRRELPSTLELAAWGTMHFNSRELENGSPDKGIMGGIGDGTGNWYLEVAPSRPEVEVLSYVRTSDGFLSSMHTQVPSYGRTHRIATFNPGSNSDRKSKLRLIHPRCPQFETLGCEAVNVTIYGVDDDRTRSPDVQLQIEPGAVREVTAAQLEGLERDPDPNQGLVGSLGDGARKWQLFITADRPIHVMSLLERAAGHLTNLSAPASRHPYPAPERP